MISFQFNITKQLITLTIVAGLLCVVSCRSSAQHATTTAQAAEPWFMFQKTPCFGTCPSYEALLHTDGTVRFVGHQYVPVTDTLTFQLTENELKALQTDLAELNYKTLQNYYKTDWSDMPATHLYFYEAGKEVKHIKHEEGGPEKLIQFNEKMHQLIWKYVATPAR
ncbi:DUF6438 domain-containing protein [Pontibacter populi]|uniref:DUF6438 domain-containing protein n=1 Tax=Pontibacter populi TaxID=890055 RepID=A0ABV1RR18_9BACT